MSSFIGVLFIWYTIDRIITKYTNKNVDNYGEIISFVHSTSTILLTSFQLQKLKIEDYTNPSQNTEGQNLILLSSTCYFTLDLFKVCIVKNLPMYIGHHISSLTILIFALINNSYATLIHSAMFYAELSVPIYSIYKYMNVRYKKKNILNFCIFITYAVLFTVTRSFQLGAILINTTLYLPVKTSTRILIFIPAFLIYSGSLVWIFKIYHKIRRKCKNLQYDLDIQNVSILDKKI